jgi:hypothetical protein
VRRRRDLERAINEVQRSGVLKRLVACEINRLDDDFSYTPERVVAGRVALHEDQCCRLDLYSVPAGEAEATTFLYSDVSSVVRIPLETESEITVTSYNAPAVRRNDVFVPTARLERVACSPLGSAHAVRMSRDGLTVHELRSDRSTVLACITMKTALPFVWGFERTSLQARLLYPSDISASRTALAVDFLKSNAHPRLPDLCTALLDSSWHFLRWKATQIMAEMDMGPLALLDRAGEFQQGNAYNYQSMVIRVTDDYLLRVNFWVPKQQLAKLGAREAIAFGYDAYHNHNFNLLTVGYSGTGYETDLYRMRDPYRAYELGNVPALDSLGRWHLGRGDVMFYEEFVDVHSQVAPVDLSVSINLMTHATRNTWPQYMFDSQSLAISAIVGSPLDARVHLLTVARRLIPERADEALAHLAKHDPSPRLQKLAKDALADRFTDWR